MKDSYEFMRMPAAMRHGFVGDSLPDEMYSMDRSMAVSPFPEKTPIAMAYVPYQQWSDIYQEDTALQRGTIFPELDLPFGGGDCAYE